MSEHTVQRGEDEIAVGRMRNRSQLPDVWEARFTQGRILHTSLRGYGRDENDAIINLLRLRAQRAMLKMLDQG